MKTSTFRGLKPNDQEVIEYRLKVITFFDQYGTVATKAAFDVGRSTVFLWKQKLREGRGKVESLKPLSTAPKKQRSPETDPRVVGFIKQYRTLHPGVDKVTVKYALDLYCVQTGFTTISESSVGRTIARLKQSGQLPKKVRLRMNCQTGKLREIKPKPKRARKRRGDFQPKQPGELVQIDAIEIVIAGLKRYLITAVDLPCRFSFAFAYKTLSSASAKDFFQKLQTVAPFAIERVQTDNGKEYDKYFREYIDSQTVIHYHNYPRCPKMNAFVERFNGVIQRQYTDYHEGDLLDPDTFNRGLMEYLLWYNTEKAHRGIGKVPPLRYYVDTYLKPSQSNMLWTATYNCAACLMSVKLKVSATCAHLLIDLNGY